MKLSDTSLPLYLMPDWMGSFAAAVVALGAAAWLGAAAVAFFFLTDVAAVTGLAGAAFFFSADAAAVTGSAGASGDRNL